jgi:hypothetical protein
MTKTTDTAVGECGAELANRPLVAQTRYERERDGELGSTIVLAIVEAEGVGPTELPPLYEVVDVDALEQLLFGSPHGTGGKGSDGTVRFQYVDYLVRVDGDGWIQVYGPPGETRVRGDD